MSRSRVISATIGLLVALAAAGDASAQPKGASKSDAGYEDSPYGEALRLYDQRKYPEAATAFEHYYKDTGDARALWNLALAELKERKPYEALTHLRAYLQRPDATAEKRDQAVALIDRARSEVAHLTIAAPEGADVEVDGLNVGRAPLPSAIDAHPGQQHVIAAKLDGRIATKSIEPPGTAPITIRLEFDRPPPRVAPIAPIAGTPASAPTATSGAAEGTHDAPERVRGMKNEVLLGSLTIIGATATAALAGAGGGVVFDGQIEGHSKNWPLAIGLFAGSAVLWGSTLVMVALWPREGAKPEKVSVRAGAAPLPGGAGMNIGGTF